MRSGFLKRRELFQRLKERFPQGRIGPKRLLLRLHNFWGFRRQELNLLKQGVGAVNFTYPVQQLVHGNKVLVL